MRLMGKLGAAEYRAFLSLAFFWDRHGARSNKSAPIGSRQGQVRATRPCVLRDARGNITTATGRGVTDRRGRAVKSPYDARAVATGEHERNPYRTRYPAMDGDDLVRLCFPASASNDAAVQAAMRLKARKAMERMEANNAVTIERLGRNPRNGRLPWRVMPYDTHWLGADDGETGAVDARIIA